MANEFGRQGVLAILIGAACFAQGCSVHATTRGRPSVYSTPTIKTVAVLGFGDEVFAGLVAERLRASKWSVIHKEAIDQAFKELNIEPASRLTRTSARALGEHLKADGVIYGKYSVRGTSLLLLDVNTGSFLVIKNVKFDSSDQGWPGYQAGYVCHYLIPWRIQRHRLRKGVAVIWTGDRADIED